MANIGGLDLNIGLAEMLKGGVIMDVVDAEQAQIAQDSGSCCCHGAGTRSRRY